MFPRKIVFYITELDIGGAEKNLFLLIKNLDKTKYDISVISLMSAGKVKDWLMDIDIPVYSVGLNRIKDIFKIVKLFKLFKKINPDILVTYLFHANITGRIIGKLCGIKTVISSIRVMEKDMKHHLYLERLTSFLVTTYFSNSIKTNEFMSKKCGIPINKFYYVNNMLSQKDIQYTVRSDEELSTLYQELNIQKTDNIILIIGRLSKQKGQIYLFKRLDKIVSEFNNVKVLLAGIGPLELEFKKYLNERNLLKYVRFLGFRNDIHDIIYISNIILLPSLWEGMPNSIIEAMLLKKIIIATNIPGTTELIANKKTGILIPKKNPEITANTVIDVLKDIDNYKYLGDAARQFVLSEFNSEKAIESFERMITKK